MEKFSLVKLLVSILIITLGTAIVIKDVYSIIDKAYSCKIEIELKYDRMFILD